jgi:hypothetical protein
MLLGISMVSVAVIKRQVETPKRDFLIWFLDIFKQMNSCAMQHLLNVGISVTLSRIYAHSDPCAWYFITVLSDCTFMTLFVVGILILQKKFIK